MNTYSYLENLFLERFSYLSLRNVSFDELKSYLSSKIGSIDSNIESFLDESKQRDLSVKFHWGHNHKFGDDFSISGHMRNRHIEVLGDFVDLFGLHKNLNGKTVLDIGVWTGGTCLLLAAMGAEVIAIEEVVNYADTVNYLAYAFGIESKLRCYAKSLYDFLPQVYDKFDIVIYPGVLYHVTDPLLSLRLIFSALKNNGSVYIETLGNDSNDSVCYYEGPSVFHGGTKDNLDRRGWNYFAPSRSCIKRWCMDVGFQEVKISPFVKSRIYGIATRRFFQDICRSGFSKTTCR